MSNFRMTAGDTKVLEVAVLDEDGATVDISDATIRFQMARFATDSAALVSKAIGSGIAIVSGPAGRFNVTLAPEDTADFSGSYWFEAELVDGDVVSTVLGGRATIDPALIKPA